MSSTLNVIEPTLEAEAGHCHSFIASLCKSAGNHPLTIWCGRSALISFAGNVRVKPFFIRKLRRLQAFWLYRKLLRQPGRIFVSTAGRTDLILLNLAAGRLIPSDKVFVYVHWFRSSPAKKAQLQKIAQRQPNLVVLTPTASVLEEFKAAGFRARLIPYPITERKVEPSERQFSHLLFAGAARRDKGFSTVVDLVELMAGKGLQLPVSVQTSADHYNKYDEATALDLKRLEETGYPYLRRQAETMLPAEYLGLFQGAICLQPYNQSDFTDRISGVTLDALSAGSPVVTLSGTWMARMVEKHDAGMVLDTTDSVAWLAAVQQIIADYDRYRDNAVIAGSSLQEEHSAGALFKALTERTEGQ